jgi:peptidyl-prolyl cis-trans isomerase SurA
MTIRSIIAIGISIAALSLSVSAQDAMERIVAVVGKEIILQSDVEGQVELLAQRNPGINKQDPKLRGLILDQLINERLIMMAAEEDTLISVSDDEISQRMEMQIGMLVQQVGSEKRLEDMYGMSMARIRREFRDEIRKQLMVEKMRQKKFGQTKAGRADVEEFYAEYKDSLPQVPERVDLYHIVRYVTVSADQSKLAYDLSLRVRDSIVKGASFGEMARRHSADLGSAVNGGDLGFVEKGKFVPAFEAAAFALEPNQISEPVETPFGWHIIQLIDKTATSINCRHILFKVGQSEDDRERTRSALTDIKKRVEAGEDFETLARELSEEKETKGFGGSMGEIDLTRLPPDMKEAINALADKGVSEPLPYAADPTKPGYHILYRKSLIRAHKATLEFDYKQIEQMATFAKKQRLEQEWVADLRKKLYWEKR